jgi:glycerate 2-kinase
MSEAMIEMLRGMVVPAVLRAADAGDALERHWVLPDEPRAVVMLGLGKAAGAMSRVATARLGDRLERALVVVREEESGQVPRADGRAEVVCADHPLPTRRNVEAGRAATRFVSAVASDERLVVLVSGGGSAMLCAPRGPLVLEDIVQLTDDLLRSGATIGQVNCVRKHCELVKGGQLAQACAGPVTAFVLSDVLGDRLDVVSSGPFAPDPTSFADALEVIRGFGLAPAHRAVVDLLERGVAGQEAETPGPGDQAFDRVEHRVISNNASAVAAAVESLRGAGYAVVDQRTGVEGEAGEVGKRFGALVRGLGPGEAVVWGGETTVAVGDSPGKGGRNQELALAAAIEIDGVGKVGVLALATDGVDGPTDAAGGVVDGAAAGAMRAMGVNPQAALAAHDSWHALEACGGLVVTGPSGTNVNDVMVGVRV